jgi:hypothetical protein
VCCTGQLLSKEISADNRREVNQEAKILFGAFNIIFLSFAEVCLFISK